MSAREWKPGDVALVRLDTTTEVRCIRSKYGDWFSASGTHYDPMLDARPLVVIDPEDREQVRAIADAAYPEGRANTNRLQAALREFASPTPPKPEEPTGLGAVVEDAEGRWWVRTCADPYPWAYCSRDEVGDRYTDACTYADIPAVRILSPGVAS